MSQLSFEVLAVDKNNVPKKSGKGTYEETTVTYKTLEGKVEQKKLLDWATNKEVYKTIGSAGKGDTFSVERDKDQNGYWQWLSISRQDGAPREVPSSRGNAVPTKPTYETPEERAQKQIYIVRQSSVASAIELLKHNLVDEPIPVQGVLSVAKQFEDFVFGQTIENVVDDLPD